MPWWKIALYFSLYIIMISGRVPYEVEEIAFLAFISVIFIDAKSGNIRALLVIIASIDVLFYELDYFIYVASLEAGIHDVYRGIFLNIGILISLLCFRIAIFKREEITAFFANVIGFTAPTYYITRADSFQLFLIRFIVAYHLVINMPMTYYGFKALTALNEGNQFVYQNMFEKFDSLGEFYVTWTFYIDMGYIFCIVFVLHDSMKRQVKTYSQIF